MLRGTTVSVAPGVAADDRETGRVGGTKATASEAEWLAIDPHRPTFGRRLDTLGMQQSCSRRESRDPVAQRTVHAGVTLIHAILFTFLHFSSSERRRGKVVTSSSESPATHLEERCTTALLLHP